MYSTYQIYLSMVVNKTATLYASIFGQISAAKTNVIFMENKKKVKKVKKSDVQVDCGTSRDLHNKTSYITEPQLDYKGQLIQPNICFRTNNNILYLSSQQPNYSRVLFYKQNTTQSQSAKPQEKQAKEINET